MQQVVTELGYQTILWNATTRDWHPLYRSGRWVRLGSFLVRLGGSSIVLLHDNLPTTADHFGRFLDRVLALGNVRFMPPDSLGSEPIRRKHG